MVGQVSMGVNPSGKYKELLVDANGKLECSVNEIEITAAAITVAVDGLEGLQGTTNTTLASILVDTDAIDSSCNTIEANSSLTASRLNNIQNKISANTDGTGDTLGQIASNIKSGVDSLSACCAGSEVQVDIVGGGFDGAITNAHLTELGTAINSAKVDVNIVSGNISGFSTSALQGTANTELTAIKLSLQSLDDIVHGEDAAHGNAHKGVMSLAVRQDTQADFGGDGDYCPMSIDANGELRVKNISGFATATLQGAGLPSALSSDNLKVSIQEGNITGFATSALQGTINTSLGTLETSLTSMEGKQNTQIGHLSEIEGAVETLESCVSGSELQVDIVGGGFDGAITNAHLTELGGAINSAKVDVNIVSGNISGFATETTLGNAEAHLGTIDTNIANAEAHLGTIDTNIANAETHLGEIEGAVETIEACCGSNKVNVNISSGNISGFATSALQGDIESSLNSLIQANHQDFGTLDTTTQGVADAVESIDSKITACNTGAVVISSGAITATLSATDNAVLDTIDAVLDTIKEDTEAIETAVEKLSGVSEAVWLNNATINAQALGASLDTVGYTKIRLYGSVDQSFVSGASDLVLMGSLTDGGAYFNINATITNQIGGSAGASVQCFNCLLESPPRFLKIKNVSGFDNYAMTINAKMTHT